MTITPTSREDEWEMNERSQAPGGPPPFHSWLKGDTKGAGRLLFSWPSGSSEDSYHANRLKIGSSSMKHTPKNCLKKHLNLTSNVT